ncbi:MAG: UDP-N-acetylmuramate dehydrogenase [Thermodesulfovibrio sp.]|nr:UDP-N-acetylmuramate dehydrogenase [Thermodesulfovibrio sp.]MDW7999210.1 UDP-N-acetylmuramate dehydrogenase [Thermodesulfovibrio sp.]
MKDIENFLKENKITYKKYEPLAKYTTLKIGGKADFVVFPDEESIFKLIEIIKYENIPYYVIGGGSNLLIKDEGFRGVIINTRKMNRIDIEGFTVWSSAGVMLPRFIAFVLKRNLSGMEGLIGIPGTVGGAIIGNAGSFGYEISDWLEEVEIITDNVEIKTLKKQDITFQYRGSDLVKTWIIKSAKFNLREDDGESFNRMKAFLQKKKQTQPLGDYSAGCVFKNPKGQSAGYLIEKAGLKGFRVGDIVISPIHANYFINIGKGKSQDFLRLMDIVKEKVFKLFSIELEPEIKILEA